MEWREANLGIKNDLLRFQVNESGSAAMEYGLVAGFISIAIIGGLALASPAVKFMFDNIGTVMSSVCAQVGLSCS